MAVVRPFRALRPRADLARKVIAPPYDVLTEAEARAIAREPDSFVHVTRSEVDLAPGSDPHSDAAYAKARENLDALVARGALVEDDEPAFTFYGQKMGGHEQIGIVGGASVDEYDRGDIAKHEHTRPDKEDDRTHHMDVLDAQVGLVFLAYRPTATLDRITREVTAAKPDWEVTTEDGVVHKLWVARGRNQEIADALAEVPRLYVADGHHRAAAASRIHAQREDDATAHFVAGLFPSDRLRILPYNRVVKDLNGRSPEAFLRELERAFDVRADGRDTPARRGEVSMYLGGKWYTLVAKDAIRTDDPVKGLDVSLLQDHLLAPILGIDDPRRSERISFVGGIRGVGALAQAVDEGAAVAFSMFPTSLEELFSVADAGDVMPPKSTWFEPKLREGVVSRRLR